MEKTSGFYKNRLSDLDLNQSKLQTEDNTLLHEEAPLRANLTAALEKLAEGDQTQDAVVDEIKKKLRPIERRREGLASLLERGRNEISRTIEQLKETEAQEARDCDAYISKKAEGEKEELRRAMAGREERLKKLWLEFNAELGEKMIDEWRTGSSLGLGLMNRIVNYPESVGYQKCNLPGTDSQQMPHAISKHGRDCKEIARARDEEDKAAWRNEWKKERGL